MAELDHEEWVAQAHGELETAIRNYFDATGGAYVSGWTVVAHLRSVEMEQDGKTTLALVEQDDQPFIETRGMLEVAVEHPSLSGRGCCHG